MKLIYKNITSNYFNMEYCRLIFKENIKIMNYEQRTDPYSGEGFIPSRYNQKFATRKNQIAFNNHKARVIREKKKPIDSVLEINRKVLLKVLNGKESTIKSKEYLLGSGFDFNFFNRSFEKDGAYYQCVYNYAVTKEKDSRYRIYLMK